MSKQPKQTSTLQFSLVPEFSWWRTSDNRRLLCVIEKWGSGVGSDYRTTHLMLIEVGIEEKKRVTYDLFQRQVQEGKLIRVKYRHLAAMLQQFI